MDKLAKHDERFYETFWADKQYQAAYAFEVAAHDRFPAIAKVWGDLKRPKTVLDFGCGNGVLTYWLWSNGFGEQIVGTDISRTGIESARKDFARPGLTFEQMEQFEKEQHECFDVLISSHVLEHIDQPELTLRKMLPKAEWLVLEVPLERCLWPALLARLRGKSRRDNPLGHVNFWDKQRFRQFLKDEGLLMVRDYHYASAPYSPFNHWLKRLVERVALEVLGLNIYSKLMATHYIVLVRAAPSES